MANPSTAPAIRPAVRLCHGATLGFVLEIDLDAIREDLLVLMCLKSSSINQQKLEIQNIVRVLFCRKELGSLHGDGAHSRETVLRP